MVSLWRGLGACGYSLPNHLLRPFFRGDSGKAETSKLDDPLKSLHPFRLEPKHPKLAPISRMDTRPEWNEIQNPEACGNDSCSSDDFPKDRVGNELARNHTHSCE